MSTFSAPIWLPDLMFAILGTMSEFPKAYEPKETEDRIYKLWQESGYFVPENLPDYEERKNKGSYVILIAPPNITGSLHMGHALENTISDILIRFHRMRGYRTLWLPGTDHAGISAQSVVEKALAKEGIKKQDLGREKFLEKMAEWNTKYGSLILDQLKKLGCSLDWSRTAFTMNPNYRTAVKTAFKHYQDKGWIYKGKRVINWSVKDQTALSDLEVYYKEQNDSLWYLKYPLIDQDNHGASGEKYITVATTRPETMLGDTAVAVHPSDERYKDLVGKKVRLPITGREVPIIADHVVEKEFGTGAVKVTPAHDFSDFEIGQRHGLTPIEVINKFGKITEAFEEFAGLKVEEARKAVAAKLEKLGAVVKIENYTHNVAYGERCHTVIEPLLSDQWFLKMDELAKKAIASIENGEVAYHPAKWREVALGWLGNIRDWNISRQIWWGHPVPIEGETDVLDTWFSSALWPFAAQGWTQPGDALEYYPTNVITSARDILHLWITRMIFSGLEFTGQVPFRDVIIHGTILTKDGKRMSKSLGTGIDPLGLIEKYGADAVRFGLIYQSLGGQQDIKYGEEFILTGKKFANKLWNIARYVLEKSKKTQSSKKQKERSKEEIAPENEPIVQRLHKINKEVTKDIENYDFGEALHLLYDFIWHEFADKYIESTKDKHDPETFFILHSSFIIILKLLHPFMPFVTEEIWQRLREEKIIEASAGKMLIVETWN